MSKIFGAIGFVFVVSILAGLATCTIHSKLLNGDAAVQPAIDATAQASRPLIGALEQYHHVHGYFPVSLEASGFAPPAADYVYDVNALNRVYQSFECAARAAQFNGVIADPGSYRQRLAVFLRECVSGYSAFELKSPRIHTARNVNSTVVAFAKFASQSGRWVLDWCDSKAAGIGDCRHFPQNESPMFAETSGAGQRHAHVARQSGARASDAP